jgi:hypothetical protein
MNASLRSPHNLHQKQTLTQIRALRGTPLTVLLTLLVAARPVTQRWLCRTTGYSEKTVARALQTLVSLGYLERCDYRHWRLARQRPALVELMPLLANPDEDGESPVSAPTAAAVHAGRVSAPQPAAEAAGPPDGSKPDFDDVCRALGRAGIFEPMRSRLAALPHVTRRYVAAHAARADEEGSSAALLIHRIRSGDPAPPDPCPRCGSTGPHALDCPLRYLAPGVAH